VATALSLATRASALRALAAEELDLLVVGGGITGAGIARDAALRGLRTGLVEAVDFAAGTSSRSSKLIHGGIRYLQQGDVALVARRRPNARCCVGSRRIWPSRCEWSCRPTGSRRS
jgi:glycerol-3-phosphate dehydrogenase